MKAAVAIALLLLAGCTTSEEAPDGSSALASLGDTEGAAATLDFEFPLEPVESCAFTAANEIRQDVAAGRSGTGGLQVIVGDTSLVFQVAEELAADGISDDRLLDPLVAACTADPGPDPRPPAGDDCTAAAELTFIDAAHTVFAGQQPQPDPDAAGLLPFNGPDGDPIRDFASSVAESTARIGTAGVLASDGWQRLVTSLCPTPATGPAPESTEAPTTPPTTDATPSASPADSAPAVAQTLTVPGPVCDQPTGLTFDPVDQTGTAELLEQITADVDDDGTDETVFSLACTPGGNAFYNAVAVVDPDGTRVGDDIIGLLISTDPGITVETIDAPEVTYRFDGSGWVADG